MLPESQTDAGLATGSAGLDFGHQTSGFYCASEMKSCGLSLSIQP